MFTDILAPTHLILLLIVALVFLGPKRLPDAGRALGQGLQEFKASITAEHDEERSITAGCDEERSITAGRDEERQRPADQ